MIRQNEVCIVLYNTVRSILGIKYMSVWRLGKFRAWQGENLTPYIIYTNKIREIPFKVVDD
jgi:hypothetical protein